ncbi:MULTISPECIES: VPA1269 family protein [Ramlibacter]|uniref:Integrase n=1 Tax=Ramlibacter pinisoli TaxID=2682844 RepID=A0A6N8ITZ5_9BURK|nr:MULTISPECIES: VPA1269 family protein [Ramlibacter]MBA2964685.1 integrase [Ramlibacter sp. CGMCC 1.13660]MVQ29650.1 integrase [Ramlibacter pinisoli]
MVKSVRYSKQVVSEVVRRVRAGETHEKVADELGVKHTTAFGWVQRDRAERGETKALPPKYTAEFKASAVQLAQEKGVPAAGQELGITPGLLAKWARKAEVKPLSLKHPKELYDEAIKRIHAGEGYKNVAASLGVKAGTVFSWSKKDRAARAVPLRKQVVWSDEDKAKALDISKNTGLAEAVAQTGIPMGTIRQWLKEAGIVHKGKRGGEGSYTADRELSWISSEYPHLDEWRPLAAQWLKEQESSVQTRLTSLRLFVRNYLHEQVYQAGLPHSPALVLSRSVLLPDYWATCMQRYAKEVGRVQNNYVHEFLNWVLLTELSEPDDHGRPVVSPQFHNPVPKKARGGGGQNAESVRSPLPYGYIDELRTMLAQGPYFRDWVWAQNGDRQKASDWFAVEESQIDKNDPDCVSRLRRKYGGEEVLEMWSPVRWVALLIKLILPLRTLQVRFLDSGEADYWRYERDERGTVSWNPNASVLAEGTERKPLRQGVFRRVLLPDQAVASAILYVNTNKTLDIGKDGTHKGYEMPWMSSAPMHSDAFYWLEKLRNWQEKYNPVSRRVAWKELDHTRLDLKALTQLASFPDACFLFRLPETGPAAAHLPMTSSSLDVAWCKLLRAFEERLAKRGEVHADGQRIRLVKPDVDWPFFPLHSLRVSLITALALEGQVPFPVLQKIAGHSRLVMTLYYTKLGTVFPQQALEEAAKRLDSRKAESIVTFLRNTEYKALVKDAIANNAAAFAAAIPEHPAARNPAGWMPMHHGLCLVGGNSAPMDSNNSIGGCYNGGPNIGSESSPRYAPTPGGARNCVRCRWFVTEPHHIWALNAHANTLFYHSDEAVKQALKTERQLSELKSERAACEEAGAAFLKQDLLSDVERLHETAMQRYSDLTEDVAATVRLMQRCIVQARRLAAEGGANGALVAVGAAMDVQMAVEEVPSELLQLSGVCDAAELYPDINPGKAVFRRSQLLDAALAREGLPPMLMTLDEEEQLVAGNAFMNKLARTVSPDNPALGRRQVVSIMDEGRSLSDALNLDVGSLLYAEQMQPEKLLMLETEDE